MLWRYFQCLLMLFVFVVVGDEVEKSLPLLMSVITQCCTNHQSYKIYQAAVDLIGDLSRALNHKIAPYCDNLIMLLLQGLSSQVLYMECKPATIACIGDVALAIGGKFAKYLQPVMGVLMSACRATLQMAPTNDSVRKCMKSTQKKVFLALSGILQGLREDAEAASFLPFVDDIVSFAEILYQQQLTQQDRSDSLKKAISCFVGDLAQSLGPLIKPHLEKPFVSALLGECISSPKKDIRNAGLWAEDVVSGVFIPALLFK
jgi:importin subunit beta-1